jgi:hypothetical protein
MISNTVLTDLLSFFLSFAFALMAPYLLIKVREIWRAKCLKALNNRNIYLSGTRLG